MTDFGSWIQANWYQLGSFFVQLGFLFGAIWFAGRILRTLRASQDQVGALLKLSVSGVSQERQEPALVSRHASEASSYWLPPTPSPLPNTAFVTSRDNPHHNLSSGPGLVGWLKSPMGITTGTSAFHRVLRWFQSPAHS